jgi:hypothetical protein
VRETHPPGGRSGVPAGCWEHTESGTPCFALRRRRARRRTRRPPAGHGLICTADRTSAAARLSRRDRSTTLNRTYLSPDNRTVHSSHSFSRQYLSVRIVLRVSGGRTSGRALCPSCSEAEYLSSEPSDQGEITSVVAKRKSNERTSFDHLQVRIPQSTDHTLGPAADWQHADLHLNLRLLCAQRYPPSGPEFK